MIGERQIARVRGPRRDGPDRAVLSAPIPVNFGFTIIELIVMVAILIVFFGLLIPALDRTIYQAELSKCASNLGEIGRGATNYVLNHRRQYPPRDDIANGLTAEPGKIVTPPSYDRRRVFRGYISLDVLQDPLCDVNVDLESPDRRNHDVWVSYALWFGWQYTNNGQPVGQGMHRMDDRWTFEGSRFRLLATDVSIVDKTAGASWSSHLDSEGILRNEIFESEDATTIAGQSPAPGVEPTYITRSILTSAGTGATTGARGTIDFNVVYDDLTVERFTDVAWDEHDKTSPNHSARMTAVNNYAEPKPGVVQQVPAW